MTRRLPFMAAPRATDLAPLGESLVAQRTGVAARRKDTLVVEHLHERVDQLARITVLTDAGDLPGLVALREQAVALAGDLAGTHADALADLARRIGSLAEAIVLGQAADADAAFREIGTVIDRLQSGLASPPQPADAPQAAPGPSDADLVAAWVAGCDGMLSDLENLLLFLERAPGDTEAIAEVRRMLHTLKGECGVLSLHVPQRLCHEAESLIDDRVATEREIPIDPLLGLLDWMKAYVQRLAGDQHAAPEGDGPVLDALLAAQQTQPAPAETPAAEAPVAAAPIVCGTPTFVPSSPTGDPIVFAPQPGTEENLADFLCEASDHIASSEEALLTLEHEPGNADHINTVFRAFHTIKGVAGFMALAPIVSLAHSAEQLLDGARAGTLTLGRAELDLVLASCDMMTRLLGVLRGSAGPTAAEFQSLVARLDAAACAGSTSPALASEARVDHPAAAHEPASQSAASEVELRTPAAPERAGSPADGAKARRTDQTVKVSTARMDNLVTLVGELVIAQQMVVQDAAALGASGQRIQRTLAHMGKMVRDLQEVSMSLRMMNLKNTFQKMTRLARDVSQKAGKQIDVVTEGEDVELDRNMVEAITDPLVHMIRNACDHGVEPADERRAAGKSPVGRVSLRAYHAGGSIVIEIADDGRGLRREKLIAKARAKGIIPKDADEHAITDAEAFALIFEPGFSTAEKVTDISGRGVGMDVVRRNIEALRGKVEIQSVPGQGTTFLIRLPLTLAIIDGMVVRMGDQRYVLPTLSIEQSFKPRPEDVKTALGAGEMVRVRGSMLPVYRLSDVLDMHDAAADIADGLLIVMESDGARFCLLVDEILGQQQVVIKTLGQGERRVRGVSGGAILGDGRVALILDVAQVVALAREASGARRNPRGCRTLRLAA